MSTQRCLQLDLPKHPDRSDGTVDLRLNGFDRFPWSSLIFFAELRHMNPQADLKDISGKKESERIHHKATDGPTVPIRIIFPISNDVQCLCQFTDTLPKSNVPLAAVRTQTNISQTSPVFPGELHVTFAFR